MGLQIKRTHHVSSTMNENYTPIEHVIMKFWNNKDSDITQKASRKKKQTHAKDYELESHQLSQQHCRLEEKSSKF